MTKWNLFDQYSLRARLQPALLALLPAALAVFAWTGPGEKWVSALWTLLGTAGITYFLAMIARNHGKELEPALWESWGGVPTTQLLRHSGLGNPILRERYHGHLSKLLGKSLPTPQEEAANPSAADDLYAAGVRLLIDRTRDTKKYPLVFKENVQYGFCRNLYGLRATGITVSVLGIVASSGAALWFLYSGNPQIPPWFCTAASFMALVLWIFTVRSSWVKVPAFAYAERLLESTENLTRPRKANDSGVKKNSKANNGSQEKPSS